MAVRSPEKAPAATSSARGRGRDYLLCALLAFATVGVFLPVTQHGFIGFDDEEYILANPMVLAGISREGLIWALRSVGYAGNWHPLTWLSHMLDVELFGTDGGSHHAVSLALHAASSALLFCVLCRMTGTIWRSGIAAALFALHPLHVESVAWAAERKDVLSGLFWMLALSAYLRYVRRPKPGRYLAVAAFFAAGLTAKPMLVTLPLVLLFLDYWPLHRLPRAGRGGKEMLLDVGRLVREKIPLLALAGASASVTILAQHEVKALESLERYPLPIRIANALLSYVVYLGKTIFPTDLAFFYPYPTSLPTWQAISSGLFLAGVTVVVLALRHARPFLVTGWLYYIVTLAPVIGVVQVGGQARADRYTYLPLIGIFVAAVWAAEKLPLRPAMSRSAGVAILLALAVAARAQLGLWGTEIKLFEHAIRVTSGNWVAEYNLGVSLSEEGRYQEAAEHYRAALSLRPDYAEAHNNLGIAQMMLGRREDAISHYDAALALKPQFVQALCNRAAAAQQLGRHGEAVDYYRRALALDPSDPRIHYFLATALISSGRAVEAQPHLREAVRLEDPKK